MDLSQAISQGLYFWFALVFIHVLNRRHTSTSLGFSQLFSYLYYFVKLLPKFDELIYFFVFAMLCLSVLCVPLGVQAMHVQWYHFVFNFALLFISCDVVKKASLLYYPTAFTILQLRIYASSVLLMKLQKCIIM